MADTHRLLTKDPAARMGVCSVCGTTRIFKKGKYYRCAAGSAQRTKTWRGENKPRAAALNKRHRNNGLARAAAGVTRAHQIQSADMLTLTGECIDCGPGVAVYRNSRTWVCGQADVFKCVCEGELTWLYAPAGHYANKHELCETCCNLLARGFVKQGLIEPVLELTWPEYRVSWDSALLELETA